MVPRIFSLQTRTARRGKVSGAPTQRVRTTGSMLVLHHAIVYSALLAPGSFDEFAQRFGKQYASPSERHHRQQVFEDNVREIALRNARGNANVTFGITAFADMTASEFRASRLLSKTALKRGLQGRAFYGAPSAASATSAPTDKNWYLQATTPIKDQGQCGSCWAVRQPACSCGI